MRRMLVLSGVLLGTILVPGLGYMGSRGINPGFDRYAPGSAQRQVAESAPVLG